MNVWLAANGRTPGSMNPIERLCYLGKRGMGALEFEPATNSEKDTSVSIELNSLVEMAQQILGQRKTFATTIKADVKKGLEDIMDLCSDIVRFDKGVLNEKIPVESNHNESILNFEIYDPEGCYIN